MYERARQNVLVSELKKVNALDRMKSFIAGNHKLCVIGGVEDRSRKRYGSFKVVFAESRNSQTDQITVVHQQLYSFIFNWRDEDQGNATKELYPRNTIDINGGCGSVAADLYWDFTVITLRCAWQQVLPKTYNQR